MPHTAKTPSTLGRRALTVALLAAANFFAFGRALEAPLVFDDRRAIVENTSIERLWPPLGDAERPGPLRPPRDTSVAGRPAVNWTLAVNYWLAARDPAAFRLVNLALHTWAGLLLALLVERTLQLEFFRGRFIHSAGALALVTALLWSVHPLVSECVIYVTQRTELLAGSSCLAALYASVRYWQATTLSSRSAWGVAAAGAALVGVASKESMAMIPLVALLYERTFLAGSWRRAMTGSWPLYFGLSLCWWLFAALNHDSPRAASVGFGLGVSAQAWWYTQCVVLWLYLRLAVWPWPLVIHYEFPYRETLAAAWPWVVATVALVASVVALVARRTAAGFVGGAALLLLLPTFVMPIVTEMAAERRMYLPLAALVAGAVVGAYQLLDHFAFRPAPARTGIAPANRALRVTVAAALVIAGAYVVVSARRAAQYNDVVLLWQDAAVHQPESARIQNNLGAALAEGGAPADALPHYEQALRLRPDYVEAQSNAGVALLKLGDTPRATEAFQKALLLDPNYAPAHVDLAHLLVQEGKLDDAIAHYRAALAERPSAAIHSNLGHALSAQGNTAEAIAQYREAVRLRPDFAEAQLNLGAELFKQGDIPRAIDCFQAAVQAQPDFGDAHSNLAIALAQTGRATEALPHFERAATLLPRAEMIANLAMAYAQTNRRPQAIAAAQQAIARARAEQQDPLAAKIDLWLREYQRQGGR